MKFYNKIRNHLIIALISVTYANCTTEDSSACKDFFNEYNRSHNFSSNLLTLKKTIFDRINFEQKKKLYIVHYLNLDCGNCIDTANKWGHFINENKSYTGRVILLIYGDNKDYFDHYIDKKIYEKLYIFNESRPEFINPFEIKSNSFLVDNNMRIITYGDILNDELFRNNVNCLIVNEDKY